MYKVILYIPSIHTVPFALFCFFHLCIIITAFPEKNESVLSRVLYPAKYFFSAQREAYSFLLKYIHTFLFPLGALVFIYSWNEKRYLLFLYYYYFFHLNLFLDNMMTDSQSKVCFFFVCIFLFSCFFFTWLHLNSLW